MNNILILKMPPPPSTYFALSLRMLNVESCTPSGSARLTMQARLQMHRQAKPAPINRKITFSLLYVKSSGSFKIFTVQLASWFTSNMNWSNSAHLWACQVEPTSNSICLTQLPSLTRSRWKVCMWPIFIKNRCSKQKRGEEESTWVVISSRKSMWSHVLPSLLLLFFFWQWDPFLQPATLSAGFPYTLSTISVPFSLSFARTCHQRSFLMAKEKNSYFLDNQLFIWLRKNHRTP